MEKASNFVGWLVALGFLVFAFAPIGSGYRNDRFPEATRVTWLMNTYWAAMARPETRDATLWTQATDYMNRCPPFRESVMPTKAARGSNECDGDDSVFVSQASEFMADLRPFENQIDILVPAYGRTPRKRPGVEAQPGIALAPANVNHRNPRSMMLEARIGSAVLQYLDTREAKLRRAFYESHGLALMLFVFLLVIRERIGELVLAPLSLFAKRPPVDDSP